MEDTRYLEGEHSRGTRATPHAPRSQARNAYTSCSTSTIGNPSPFHRFQISRTEGLQRAQSFASAPFTTTSVTCREHFKLRYNRQGRKVQDLRSKCNTRTQRARNTGTYNYPTARNANNKVTNDYSTSVLIGGPQPVATLDGLQPLPGGWHNNDTRTLDT